VRWRRLLALGAGIAAGGYLVDRWRRNQAVEARPLRDARGRSLEPVLVELAGGETVPVIDAGTGPPIVLVPGLTGESQIFRYQIEAFTARQRVIAPNLRVRFEGVARRFDQYVHDLAAVLDALGVPAAVLLGLSFGGAVCMRFATLYPERARALVLTCTLARLDLSHVGLNRTLFIPLARSSSRYLPQALVRRLAEIWGHWGIWVFDPSAGNERIVEYELETPLRVPGWVSNARLETFRKCDLRPDLPELGQPTLVVGGLFDTYTPLEWQREIARLIPGATYVEIPYGGHLSLISHAETFNRVVLEWLDTLQPPQ
jgi:3-oxoadipate enol-lactonase